MLRYSKYGGGKERIIKLDDLNNKSIFVHEKALNARRRWPLRSCFECLSMTPTGFSTILIIDHI